MRSAANFGENIVREIAVGFGVERKGVCGEGRGWDLDGKKGEGVRKECRLVGAV